MNSANILYLLYVLSVLKNPEEAPEWVLEELYTTSVQLLREYHVERTGLPWT